VEFEVLKYPPKELSFPRRVMEDLRPEWRFLSSQDKNPSG